MKWCLIGIKKSFSSIIFFNSFYEIKRKNLTKKALDQSPFLNFEFMAVWSDREWKAKWKIHNKWSKNFNFEKVKKSLSLKKLKSHIYWQNFKFSYHVK